MIKITCKGNKVTFEIEDDILGGRVEGFAGRNDLSEQMKLGQIVEDPSKPVLLRLACVAKIQDYIGEYYLDSETWEEVEKSFQWPDENLGLSEKGFFAIQKNILTQALTLVTEPEAKASIEKSLRELQTEIKH